MPTTDPKSGIVHSWAYGEDNWNGAMDADLKKISRAGLHLAVLDKDLATPPGSPADGDSYIVAATGTGDWVGQEDNIAYWDGAAWVFYTPAEGWYADVADEDTLYRYDGAAWAAYSAGGGGGGGGEWALVESIALTGLTGTTFTIDSTENELKLVIVGCKMSATSNLSVRISGSTISQYSYFYHRMGNLSDHTVTGFSSATSIVLANIALQAQSGINGEVLLRDCRSLTGSGVHADWRITARENTRYRYDGVGGYIGAVTALEFYTDNGATVTFDSGYVELWKK